MPDNNDEMQKASTTFEVMEKIAKAIVAVVALSYALGMVVSNQYLIALGSSDFSSVRPKYVLTGCWVLLMILLFSLPVLLPLISFDSVNKRRLVLLAVLGLTFSLLVGGLFLYILHFDYRYMNEQPEVIGAVITLALLICIGTVLLVIGIRQVRTTENINTQFFGYGIMAVILCSVLAAVTSETAQHIYTHIPEAMGGGKAVMATIILNDKGVEFWGQFVQVIPNPVAWPKRSIQVAKILYQDHKELILEIEHERRDHPDLHLTNKTLILKRELVDGIYVDSYANRL
jgi:hypothetical protein